MINTFHLIFNAFLTKCEPENIFNVKIKKKTHEIKILTRYFSKFILYKTVFYKKRNRSALQNPWTLIRLTLFTV